jgi:cytochrome c oxidase subunit 2
MRRCRRLPAGIAATLLSTALLGGCDRAPSTLDPAGPKSDFTTWAWWGLFAAAAFVCCLIIGLTVLAAIFRRRSTKVKTGDGRRFVLVFGVILPAIVFASVFALGVGGLVAQSEPPSKPAMTVDVIGHQWWWEFRYEGTDAVTANYLHVPVGTPVELRLRTHDVIHSFWIPQVMPKMDLLPKRINKTWLSVDRPGTYQGECAEYCGAQHAHMDFALVAQSHASFQAWLQREQRAAAPPTTDAERSGMQFFTSASCSTCHTIRGTSADGKLGPDLTHVGSRPMLAAGLIPNDVGHMSGWIANSQAVKPGNLMPPQHLTPSDLRDVVAYLQSLK